MSTFDSGSIKNGTNHEVLLQVRGNGAISGGAHESWQHTFSGQQGPGVADPIVASLGHLGSASQEGDSDGMDFSVPRKSRLSGPQLQAQFSRLTDRSRLRRLKDTLLLMGARQQVTRIEVLCHHAHVSHKMALPPGHECGKCPDAA